MVACALMELTKKKNWGWRGYGYFRICFGVETRLDRSYVRSEGNK